MKYFYDNPQTFRVHVNEHEYSKRLQKKRVGKKWTIA